ncbi:uncharacterized protein LOC126655668 [Mercurialis annua]|uniref:uncharacterized protein LOC126655668 n=1 Tax=Mercurialis annua TaxID=3986 RepID=UPI00215EDC33|nr:uncharacterized protein LOC126655668 [Mercurialis annua]
MSSPTTSTQNQNPNSPQQDPNSTQQEENQNPPQSDNPQSPKTLTLEIPDDEVEEDEENPNQDSDLEDTTPHFSPSVSDSHVSTITTSTTTTTTVSVSRRGGHGKRKKKRSVELQKKKSLQKLELLGKNLKIVPFRPVKTLDFSSHEFLLKGLGLWEFVHLQFDVDNLRADFIAQLIANFNPNGRSSYVNGARIKVNRADLARALRLPVKKDKVETVLDDNESKESIEFVEELVSTWFLLYDDDTWMMSDEIWNFNKLIKDGNFDKVDWSKLIWLMVEKELTAAPSLGNCYYASHLQLLIKSQKDELFKEEVVEMEVDVKKADEEAEDVKINEEIHEVSELEEHNIELSLGGLDNVVKDDDDEKEKEEEEDGKEGVGDGDGDAMDFEESKDDEEQGQWRMNSMDGGFLQRCGEVGVLECEVQRKQEDNDGEEEGNEGEGEDVEEEEDEEMGFNISPKGDGLRGLSSENLIAAMEASQIPFSSGVEIHDNVPSGDFLTSMVDTQPISGSSSLFNNGNVNKRAIEHLEDDMPQHSLNGTNKKMRSDVPWGMMKSPSVSEVDVYFDQMEYIAGKTRALCKEKEQTIQEMSVQQQMLMNELQERDNYIDHLVKAKMEEQQKRQVETYRYEHELQMMGNLLEGYRKALKETHKSFAAYRAKCSLPEVPIYKDTGVGGLVLSTMELEKLRLKQEEEKRLSRLFIEKMIKEFEAEWTIKFEACNDRVEVLCNSVLEAEKKVSLLKEDWKYKVLKKLEAATAEECITHESV